MSSQKTKQQARKHHAPTKAALDLLLLMQRNKNCFAAIAGASGEIAGLFTESGITIARFSLAGYAQLIASGFVTDGGAHEHRKLREADFFQWQQTRTEGQPGAPRLVP